MKKTISLIVVFVICIMSLVSCSKADDYVPAGYKKASNKNADYDLFVPAGWTVDISTGVTTAYATDKSNISFVGFELDDTMIRFDPVTPDDEDEPSDDGEELDIKTVDDYWKYYESTFSSTFSDMEYLINGENMLISGIEAKKYAYKATVTEIEYVFLQVVALKNKTVYVFTYTAKESLYESHLEEVEEMLGYLSIK